MSELELSDSDSDSFVGSILGACLDGFDGDTWMSEAEGAHDDIQVGEAAGVNDPSDIPWHTTTWRAGTEVVPSAKVAKTAVESRKQSSSTLSGKTVTFDPHGVEISENGDGDGDAEGGVQLCRGSENDEAATDPRGQASVGNTSTEWVVLSDSERMELKELKRLKKKQRQSPARKNRSPSKGGHDEAARHARHLKHLSNL